MKRSKLLGIFMFSSLLAASEALACGSERYKANSSCNSNKAYIRADVGAAMLAKNLNKKDYSKKAKTSPSYSVGFGYKFNKYLRSDLTATYRGDFKYSGKSEGGDSESQKINSTAFMLNGYYDIVNYNGFVPYVMGGAGVAYNKADAFTQQDSIQKDRINGATRANLAWQVGAGTQYKINKNIALDLGYKYVDLGKINTSTVYTSSTGARGFTNAITGKLRSHDVTFGVSYKF
jgi:opacity protein-like surface antigen